MSVDALSWAFKQRPASAVDKLVLLTLADFANEGFVSNLTQAKIARRSLCSIDTVQRALQRLEKGGYIIRQRQYDNHGLRMPNGYVIPARKIALNRKLRLPHQHTDNQNVEPHLGAVTGFRSRNGAAYNKELLTREVVQGVASSGDLATIVTDASPTHLMDGPLRQDGTTDRGAKNSVCGEDTGARVVAAQGGRA